jgi:hypothetical protein
MAGPITFVESQTTLEPFRGIGFLLEIEGQRFLLPPNALYRLDRQCRAASTKALIADLEADARVVPFPTKKRRRPR